jgi:hypothetical protein
LHFVAPMASLYWPAAHAWHVPSALWTFPAAQAFSRMHWHPSPIQLPFFTSMQFVLVVS